jgi:tetratricopeptide (TPR) repeat protein
MSYLVLYIDTEFIVGTVCVDNGNSYPVTNGSEDLLWLYFFNNPHQNRISFGKDNRVHYNNKSINYYGHFFELIENEQEAFIIRGIQKKSIELLEYSGLLKTFKEKYESVTLENTNQIPVLITFSFSISELAKQKTVEYLKSQGFQIDSYTIPLSELACYYPFSKKEFIPANGNTVLLLAATNTSLHLMKLTFSDSYFMIDGAPKIYKGKGIDPRKRALVKLVVNEVNKSVGALSTQDEIEDECARKEQKAEEWLKRIDIQQQNRPLSINESLSIMPNATKQILVRKENIESDTGHYIQELMDIFDAFKSDNVKGNVSAIFLLGDCFQNSLVKERFEKLIHNEKLFLFANKDIQQILSVYPKVDFKRYIDQEARIKALAEAEELKQAEQRALEDRQRKEAEEEAKQQAEIQKAEQNRKEAEHLFERAVELEKEGRLEDARVNAENAFVLDKNNRDYKQFVSDLVEKIDKLNAKNKLYKSYLNKADKFLEKNKLEQALEEYEAAKKVFDNAEITKKIIEVERLIKNTAKKKEQQEKENKEKYEKIIVVADKLFSEEKWAEAKLQFEMALKLCPQEKSIKDKIKRCANKIKEKEDASNDLILEANIAEKKEKFSEAISFLEKALQIKSDDADIKRRIKNIKFKLNFERGNNMLPPLQKKDDDFLPKEKPRAKKNDDDWDFSEVAKSKSKNNEESDFLKKTQKYTADDDFLKIKYCKYCGNPTGNGQYCKFCGKPI